MLRGAIAMVVASAAVVAGSGCGASDEDRVADSARTYLTAVVRGDGATACAHMTAPLRQAILDALTSANDELIVANCPQAIAELSDWVDPDVKSILLHSRVTGVAIRGDRARAHLAPARFDLLLVRGDSGDWRVSDMPQRRRRPHPRPPRDDQGTTLASAGRALLRQARA